MNNTAITDVIDEVNQNPRRGKSIPPMTPEAVSAALAIYQEGSTSIQAVKDRLHVGQAAFYKLLAAAGVDRRDGVQAQTDAWTRRRTPRRESQPHVNPGESAASLVRKPARKVSASDNLPCGWDGISPNMIVVGRGELTCTSCGEVVQPGRACPRCEGETIMVPTLSYLKEGEWRMAG